MGSMVPYDALLVVSFGGPESPDEVMPFLENVVRGRNVPRERLLEVAAHYHHCGGRSPINEQNRALAAAVGQALARRGTELPVYLGNRNWRPLLGDVVREMQSDGVRRALAFVTSAYSSWSGCRQYLENIEQARAQAGAGAPSIEKLRVFFNHPRFITAVVERVQEALARISPQRRAAAPLVFTAHSIPLSMAEGCRYEEQLREACRLASAAVGREQYLLAWQSRSGPPTQPWLEPDILDVLRELADAGATDVVVVPIGFLSDHIEVLYDLDHEAAQCAAALGLFMARAATVGTHPEFVEMICDLVDERLRGVPPQAIGKLGPWHDVCPADCCPPVVRKT
ncbi:MAG: ferrochelatase [Pirellulales bacterium]|nr:ferrochelatase [Pirellulales bacterium]